MIKQLKERIEFRRRRKIEKKLRKYVAKYTNCVLADEKLFTEGELKHIDDIASYCYIDIHRIASSVDIQLKRRFGSRSYLKYRLDWNIKIAKPVQGESIQL